ncbi:Thiol-disulfide isomerase or thioredoxin [bacterium A37T11]|nr:Thiol-disulfide isomerase or thioredoxin [bacterium A37T11]
MKTFVNSLVLYIVLTGHGFAQTKEKTIGSDLSSYQLKGLLGADRTTKSIDDYKGKLVILDFWFTACSTCIAAMPRMRELQDKYKDRLQIIFVNDLAKDDETAVNKIRQNFRKQTGLPLTIPFLLKDSVLTDEYFPHQGDPFEVWIDQTGKLIATTGGDQVTEENIIKALKGVKMDVSMRKDLLTFNRDEPLFINGNGENKEGMIYHSVIAKFTDGLVGSEGFVGDQDSIRGFTAINTRLIDL